MMYDDKRRSIVAASVQPKSWKLITKSRTTSAAHSHPCVAALFNDQFQQVVTADQAGTVCVWDAHTGEIDFRFQNTHGGGKLTAAGFDGGKRRLITGGGDGRLLMWNFSNGNKLKELTSPTEDEVTALSGQPVEGTGAEVAGKGPYHDSLPPSEEPSTCGLLGEPSVRTTCVLYGTVGGAGVLVDAFGREACAPNTAVTGSIKRDSIDS